MLTYLTPGTSTFLHMANTARAARQGDLRHRTLGARQNVNGKADTWAAFTEPHDEWKGMPALQAVPLQRLVDATGLSKTVCSQVRRGLKVPHARHWDALTHL